MRRLLFALLLLVSVDPGLTVRYEGTSATLSWQQPPGIARTCLYRFYGAEWPSARCWHDLEAGAHADVWRADDGDPAYRAGPGDVFKLCFSQETEDGLHCEFVASVAIGETRVYRQYLPIVRGGAALVGETRLPVVMR